MSRKKHITQITDKDFDDVIKNSVQNAATRLVGSPAEIKKAYVKPIANKGDGANVLALLQRAVAEAEDALDENIKNTVLALNVVPEFIGKTYAEIKQDYEENKAITDESKKDEVYKTEAVYSVWISHWSKQPTVGDVFTSIGTSKDGYAFGFQGRIVKVDGGTIRFAFDDLVELVNPTLIPNLKAEIEDKISVETAERNSAIAKLDNEKQDNLAFDGTYNAVSNKVATVETVSKIVADKIADVVAGADTKFDTLKEIADWIKAHPESVAQINASIQANTDKISANTSKISSALSSISQINNTLPTKANNADLAKVAKSGAYEDLKNQPTLVETIFANVENEKLKLALKDKVGQILSSTEVDFPRGGGGSQEIVFVTDEMITEMEQDPEGTKFLELSERAVNGEIQIAFADQGTQFTVTTIEYSKDERTAYWYSNVVIDGNIIDMIWQYTPQSGFLADAHIFDLLSISSEFPKAIHISYLFDTIQNNDIKTFGGWVNDIIAKGTSCISFLLHTDSNGTTNRSLMNVESINVTDSDNSRVVRLVVNNYNVSNLKLKIVVTYTGDREFTNGTIVYEVQEDYAEGGGLTEEQLAQLQTKTDERLNTTDKNVVGAINEVQSNVINFPYLVFLLIISALKDEETGVINQDAFEEFILITAYVANGIMSKDTILPEMNYHQAVSMSIDYSLFTEYSAYGCGRVDIEDVSAKLTNAGYEARWSLKVPMPDGTFFRHKVVVTNDNIINEVTPILGTDGAVGITEINVNDLEGMPAEEFFALSDELKQGLVRVFAEEYDAEDDVYFRVYYEVTNFSLFKGNLVNELFGRQEIVIGLELAVLLDGDEISTAYVSFLNGDVYVEKTVNGVVPKPTDADVGKVLAVTKSGSNAPKYEPIEISTAGGSAPDLSDYVKFTDYPKIAKPNVPRKAGVIHIDTFYGFMLGSSGSEGVIMPIWASNTEIDDKSKGRFINPSNLDYALIKSLTTNANTLTDEEKSSAREWLDAVGSTDYATRDKFGVVKVGSGLISNRGQLLIEPATQEAMAQGAYYSPITASGLANAMYVGITGRKTTDYGKTYTYGNQIPLSDAEKDIVHEWLGIDEKLGDINTALETILGV